MLFHVELMTNTDRILLALTRVIAVGVIEFCYSSTNYDLHDKHHVGQTIDAILDKLNKQLGLP